MEIFIDDKVEQIGVFSDLHSEDDLFSLFMKKHPEIKNWFCLCDVVDMFAPNWKNLHTLRKSRHYKTHLIKKTMKKQCPKRNIRYILTTNLNCTNL